VRVLVRHVNRAPSASAVADFSADERSAASLSATGTDPDGDTVQYSWVQIGGPAAALSSASAAAPTFTVPEVSANATLTFVVTVSDGSISSTATVRVSVRNVNRAPVANAGDAQEVTERTLATLGGSATDADGDSLTYEWTQTDGPAVSLNNARLARPSFIAPDVNTAGVVLTFSLTVSDGSSSITSTTQVTVKNANRKPRANAGANQTALERGLATLVGAGSTDEDGDELRYTWTQVSGPSVTLRNGATAAPSFDTPEVSADTNLTFKLVVNDGSQDSDAAMVEVLVKNVNRAPKADAGEHQLVTPGEVVTLHGNSSGDPDSTPITFAWKQVAGPDVTLSDAAAAEPTFQLTRDVQIGTRFLFELTVTDLDGVSATSLVSVVVQRAAGGCSVASGDSSASALLPLLFLGAALVVARRRRNA
jgi:MYXO-CTERM domain-containing protein